MAETSVEVTKPEKTQDQLDFEKYVEQLDKLVKQKNNIEAELNRTNELISQSRGIILYLQSKIKSQ